MKFTAYLCLVLLVALTLVPTAAKADG